MVYDEIIGSVGSHVDHIGIAVNNLEIAQDFYSLIGFRCVGKEIVDEQMVEVTILEGGETRIELLVPTSEKSPIRRFLDKRGEGLHHIALSCIDIQGTIEKLKTEDSILIDRSPRIGAGGHKIAFIHPKSTGGVLVELIEKENIKSV